MIRTFFRGTHTRLYFSPSRKPEFRSAASYSSHRISFYQWVRFIKGYKYTHSNQGSILIHTIGTQTIPSTTPGNKRKSIHLRISAFSGVSYLMREAISQSRHFAFISLFASSTPSETSFSIYGQLAMTATNWNVGLVWERNGCAGTVPARQACGN